MEENRWASSYQINAIATRALVDADFKQAILNGQRRQRLQEFIDKALIKLRILALCRPLKPF
jgi:hypothetical protein